MAFVVSATSVVVTSVMASVVVTSVVASVVVTSAPFWPWTSGRTNGTSVNICLRPIVL